MWPQFEQIKRPLERTVIGGNVSPTTQYGQRASFFRVVVKPASLVAVCSDAFFSFQSSDGKGTIRNLLLFVFSGLQVYKAMKQAGPN
jgi:hypothetical protein